MDLLQFNLIETIYIYFVMQYVLHINCATAEDNSTN